MKRLILTSSLVLAAVTLPIAALATTANPPKQLAGTLAPTVAPSSNLPTPSPVPPKTLTAAAQATRLANLKSRGAAEINRRLTSLQASLTAIGATTKLSASDKATLTGQVQTEIAGLTALNAKLAADTTLPAARLDVQSIFNDFRVYALMLPKVRLVTTDDGFVALGVQFDALATTLQTKITAAKSAGKDVASAQAALTDLQAKLTDAKTKYDGLAAKVIGLSPSDYNAYHALLAADRDALVTARADFKAARADVDTIITALGGKASSPSPSTSPKA